MRTPLLTIVIPTFKSAKTIRRCLDSIVAQTFTNYEVWVIDGASTDATVTILQEYATQHAFIHVVSEPDKGIYDAMNKGITLSEGEWLYFLGSDDYLVNEFVLDAVLTEKNVTTSDFIYGNVLWGDSCYVFAGQFDWIKMASGNICHQAIFYRRSLLSELGNFNIRYPLLADHDLNIKVFHSRYRILYSNKVIAFFSLDGSSGKGSDPLQLEMNEKNRSYLKEKTISEKLQYYYFVTPRHKTWKVKFRKLMLFFCFFILNWRDIRLTRNHVNTELYPWEMNG